MPDTASRHLGYLYCVLFTLIFSLHYLVASIVLKEVDSLALGALRGLVGGSILAVIYRRQLTAPLQAPQRFRMLAAGLLGFCVNQALLLEGLKRSQPADAALLANMIPLGATALGVSLGRETLSRTQFFGLILGFFAVASYLLWQRDIDLSAHAFGNLLILANVACFCVALVIIKDLVTKAGSGPVTAWMLLIGGAILALAAGSRLEDLTIKALASPHLIMLLAFEAIVVTAGGYLLNFLALRHLPLSITTSFAYFQPPLTAALAFLIGGDVPTWGALLLFILVLVATVMVRRQA